MMWHEAPVFKCAHHVEGFGLGQQDGLEDNAKHQSQPRRFNKKTSYPQGSSLNPESQTLQRGVEGDDD